MKKTLNLALITTMFATLAFADDGNQGSGGRTCDPQTDPTCHPVAHLDGDGNGNGEDTGYELGFDGILIRIITDTIDLIR